MKKKNYFGSQAINDARKCKVGFGLCSQASDELDPRWTEIELPAPVYPTLCVRCL